MLGVKETQGSKESTPRGQENQESDQALRAGQGAHASYKALGTWECEGWGVVGGGGSPKCGDVFYSFGGQQ